MVSPLAAAARACWIVEYGQPLGQTSSVAACAGTVFMTTRPAAMPSSINHALAIASSAPAQTPGTIIVRPTQIHNAPARASFWL